MELIVENSLATSPQHARYRLCKLHLFGRRFIMYDELHPFLSVPALVCECSIEYGLIPEMLLHLSFVVITILGYVINLLKVQDQLICWLRMFQNNCLV